VDIIVGTDPSGAYNDLTIQATLSDGTVCFEKDVTVVQTINQTKLISCVESGKTVMFFAPELISIPSGGTDAQVINHALFYETLINELTIVEAGTNVSADDIIAGLFWDKITILNTEGVAFINQVGLKVTLGTEPGTVRITIKDTKGVILHQVEIVVLKRDGGLIITSILDTFDVPLPENRPTGYLDRLYSGLNPNPNGPNPTDLQVVIDTLISAPESLGLSLTKFIATLPFVPSNLQIVASPGFSLGGLNEEDREWLTLLFLSLSTNSDPPSTFANPSTFDPDLYRMLNELRFCYFIDDGLIDQFIEERNSLLVGNTLLDFPIQSFVVHIAIDGDIKSIPIIFPVDFPTQVASDNISVVPTGLTGGIGNNFVESALYARAGRTLTPYENALLKFSAPPFFSEVRFDIVNGNIQYNPVLGHTSDPEFLWPSHFVYQWDDGRKLYTNPTKHLQTGRRGPFAKFISVGSQTGDPAPGPQPSDTHKLSPNY